MSKDGTMFESHEGMSDKNRLLYGDCLQVMKKKMNLNEVDLVYLDPPFNSNKSYNMLYKNATGMPIPEQIEAFCDAWTMDEEKLSFIRKLPVLVKEYNVESSVVEFWVKWMEALRNVQPKMLAYLVYMTQRLLEIRAILSPTGSVYLHCDPTASHYIKVIMDGIFGHDNFRNEIVWVRRKDKHNLPQNHMGKLHDVIFFYSKRKEHVYKKVYQKYTKEYTDKMYKYNDDNGFYRLLPCTNERGGNKPYDFRGIKRAWRFSKNNMQDKYDKDLLVQLKEGSTFYYKKHLKNAKGVPLQDVWDDIPPVRGNDSLGYPTQKPIKLLERIILASTNEGDTVFDPFCGCGTSLYASHLLKRRWIGCDIALHAHNLIKVVLAKRYGLKERADYSVGGIPETPEQADKLFEGSPLDFQNWVVENLCYGFRDTKYSYDGGVDGRLYFETEDGLKNMVISVKGGNNIYPKDVRELQGAVSKKPESEIGGLVVRVSPTARMKSEALESGVWEHKGVEYQRTQIRTVKELMDGKYFETPNFVEILHKSRQGEIALR